MWIISILENYLNEDTEENLDNIELEEQESDKEEYESDKEEHESDKENQPFTLNNPNWQTKPKGRPKIQKELE